MVCYSKLICLVVVGYLLALSCDYFHLQEYFCYSNNMLYPKEDKENKVLLYAVSTICLTVEGILVSWIFAKSQRRNFYSTFALPVNLVLLIVNYFFIFQCRNCEYKQLADSNCIYVNKIMHEIEWVKNVTNRTVNKVLYLTRSWTDFISILFWYPDIQNKLFHLAEV